MNRIIIILLKIVIKRTTKKRELIDNSIVLKAYDHMLRNYNGTIDFLEAQIESHKKAKEANKRISITWTGNNGLR